MLNNFDESSWHLFCLFLVSVIYIICYFMIVYYIVLVVQFSISASIIPCWHMSHVIRYLNVNNVWIIFDPKIILSLNLQHKQQFIVMLQPFKSHNMECCIKLNQRSVGSSPLSSQLSGVNCQHSVNSDTIPANIWSSGTKYQDWVFHLWILHRD